MSENTLTLQCILIRKGGTVTELNGNTYHFAPNAEGDHVCDVSDDDDIARLLSIPEAYRIYRPKKATPAPAAPAAPAPVKQETKEPAPAPAPAKEEAKAPAPAKVKATKAKAAKEEKAENPMGIPAAEKIEALETMSRDEVAAIFKDVVGRAPSEHAEVEVMIAQIEAKRAETAAG